ncbi:HIRAN domain-containing protein [Salinicoccus halodurans]|uniref:HIRAN domain-containing protein n=1 Tax=Salinicoccus halodurans TaxID=407035 RepID=A0AA94KXS0_9STAP|nr:HIRAN domain-containing protein [Salinicoccus halodurans]SFK95715.1 Protein of unknown function [Salinicoccus halodurans]
MEKIEYRFDKKEVSDFRNSSYGKRYNKLLLKDSKIYGLDRNIRDFILYTRKKELESLNKSTNVWTSTKYFLENHFDIFNFHDLFTKDKGLIKFFIVVSSEQGNTIEKICEDYNVHYKIYSCTIKETNVQISIFVIYAKNETGREIWRQCEYAGLRIGVYSYSDITSKSLRFYKIYNGRSFPLDKPATNNYYAALSGYRKDLRHSFKSKWEADFARFLEFQNLNWLYEDPSYFIDTGGKYYLPDFYIKKGNDSVLVEIKGRWDKRSLSHIDYSLRKSDNNHLIIDSDVIKILTDKYKTSIPSWETNKMSFVKKVVPVVGTNIANRTQYINKLSKNDSVCLIRENNNLYDEFAIMVTDELQNQIGYIKSEWASIISEFMNYGFTFDSKIEKIERNFINISIKVSNVDFNKVNKSIIDSKIKYKLLKEIFR